MKNLISAVFVSVVILGAGTVQNASSQNIPYSFEQLQRRLDSLEFLQQEAIRGGNEQNLYAGEIRQLQRAITTKSNEQRAEIAKRMEESPDGNIGAPTERKVLDFDFFAERPLLDNLVIVMGAIAIASAIFLLLAKIFIAISKNRKPKIPKSPKIKQKKSAKNEDLQKTANVLSEIDRYKEKESQKAEFNESVIATLRELSRNEAKIEKTENVESPKPEEEQAKKPRAIDLKNEIVRRFDKNEDTVKIAQDLGISKDQVLMILNLAGRK